MTTERKFTQTDSKEDAQETVVISGAGPAGLSLALNLIRKDPTKKIVIVEAREKKFSKIRPQIVHLDNDTRSYLRSLIPENSTHIKDQILLSQLSDPKEHIAIKDIQGLFKRRLKNEKNCTFLYDSKITEINTATSTLKVSSSCKQEVGQTTPASNQHIQFKHLIDAGGMHHDIADILKKQGHPIDYTKTTQSKRECVISTYFRVQNKYCGQVKLPKDILMEHSQFDPIDSIAHRAFIYFNRLSHAKTQGQQLKFFVTSSIPNRNYDFYTHNKERGIKFLKLIAHSTFDEKKYTVLPVKPSIKHGKVKDDLKYQTFKRIFFKNNVAGLTIANSGYLFIGDAYLYPDFYQGIGTNNAIMQGIDAADYILGNITLEIFNDLSEMRAQEQLLNTLVDEAGWNKTDDESPDKPQPIEISFIEQKYEMYNMLSKLKILQLKSPDADGVCEAISKVENLLKSLNNFDLIDISKSAQSIQVLLDESSELLHSIRIKYQDQFKKTYKPPSEKLESQKHENVSGKSNVEDVPLSDKKLRFCSLL